MEDNSTRSPLVLSASTDSCDYTQSPLPHSPPTQIILDEFRHLSYEDQLDSAVQNRILDISATSEPMIYNSIMTYARSIFEEGYKRRSLCDAGVSVKKDILVPMGRSRSVSKQPKVPSLTEILCDPAISLKGSRSVVKHVAPRVASMNAILCDDGDGPLNKKPHLTNQRFHRDDERAVLRTWMSENVDYPYPSPQEKSELAVKSNLTVKQVELWFTNTRRRCWRRTDATNSRSGPRTKSGKRPKRVKR